MYDKRPGWFLAAAAADRGSATRLADSFASVVVEIPTSKQNLADSWTGRMGSATAGTRRNIFTGERSAIACSPSSEISLRNSFAQVSSFFPGTKVIAAELMEFIAAKCGDRAMDGSSLIFDDQYISTGGQFVELMTGRDRFCCDLRPVFYAIQQKRSGESPAIGLQCHPYDVAGLLAARNAGVVLTDGWGEPLDAPFDITSPVHWCGYANPDLEALVAPAVADWLAVQLA